MSEPRIEYCSNCDEPTGNAGRMEDSNYTEEGVGPFCDRCFSYESHIEILQADLRRNVSELVVKEDAIKAFMASVCVPTNPLDGWPIDIAEWNKLKMAIKGKYE